MISERHQGDSGFHLFHTCRMQYPEKLYRHGIQSMLGNSVDFISYCHETDRKFCGKFPAEYNEVKISLDRLVAWSGWF